MQTNRSIPKSAVIPQLPYPDVEKAVKWLCDTFGFTVRIAIGNHRAQLNVGDGAIVVMELPGSSDSPIDRAYPMVRRRTSSLRARAATRGAHCSGTCGPSLRRATVFR